jgi:DNA-binding LacI/PurR family transcriptional regulator
VILIRRWNRRDQLNKLAARHIQIVVWGERLPQLIYRTIGSDEIAGGILATEHLINTVRRSIAFFDDRELPEIGHRHEGDLRVLKEHSIAYESRPVRPTAFAEGSAQRTIKGLIEGDVRFDAIFACSDRPAMCTVRALREFGLLVPTDVAVVGCDDIEPAQYFHPSLTMIRQPIDKGGEALVDALLGIVESQHPTPLMLATDLMVRESSAPRPREP